MLTCYQHAVAARCRGGGASGPGPAHLSGGPLHTSLHPPHPPLPGGRKVQVQPVLCIQNDILRLRIFRVPDPDPTHGI